MKKRLLSNLEGTLLIAGSGIGTGILTLPYAIKNIGLSGALIAMLFAYFISAIIFIFIIFMILENLIVYIICASELMNQLLGFPILISRILFYIIATIVILFGIRGISNGEKVSVSLITIVIITLLVLSIFNINNPIKLSFGDPLKVLAVYGLFMFAFSSIFSLIQVTNYIKDKKSIKKVAIGGLTINAILTLVFALATIMVSKEVTSIATIGITDTLNIPIIKIMCSIFVLLAMFSSYWTSGLAFSDIIEVQMKKSKRVSWIISTIPTIIIALIVPFSILDFIQIGAGALSIILVLVILPAYYRAVKYEKKPLLGKYATSKTLLGIVALFIILMAIASFIPIS